MTKSNLSRSLAAACLGLALTAAPVIAHAAPVPPPAAATPATDTTKATPKGTDVDQTEQRYAAREASAPQTAEFKGQGAGLYIGGSTAAVVLLIVLVVILL